MSRNEMNPLNHLGDLRREMDRLFDTFVGGVNRNLPFRLRSEPPVNLIEDGECLRAEIEIPGVNMADIEVQVADDELIVKGHRAEPATENVTFHKQERMAGSFTRFVDLPVEVDAAKVEAVLKDGVLAVTMPKTESVRSRRITVKGE